MLTIYGVTVLTFMMVMYALEGRDRRFVVAFALGSRCRVVTASRAGRGLSAWLRPSGASLPSTVSIEGRRLRQLAATDRRPRRESAAAEGPGTSIDSAGHRIRVGENRSCGPVGARGASLWGRWGREDAELFEHLEPIEHQVE